MTGELHGTEQLGAKSAGIGTTAPGTTAFERSATETHRPPQHLHARMLTVPIVLAGSLAVTGAIGLAQPAHAAGGPHGARTAHPPRPSRDPAASRAASRDTITVAAGGQGVATGPRTTPARTAVARTTPTVYTVRRGDTVSGIAAHFGLSTSAVLKANGLSWNSTIFPGQRLALTTAPSPAPHATGRTAPSHPRSSTHTVVSGETVSGIAAAAGVSTRAVLEANDLSSDSIIRPGQKLVIPGAGATPTRPARADDTAAHHERASADRAVTDEMAANARIIISVGRAEHVPDRGIVVALTAAIQESGLRNLAGGDRDSVGLFQQRPSMGWGTAAQLHDPRYAATAFYGGAHNPHPDLINGLLDIAGWHEMSIADAAQAVQISAEPDAYGRWEADAQALLAALG